MIRESLIFEISDKGKRGYFLPKLDVPKKVNILEGIPVRKEIPDFPEISEVEVVRHFTRLSQTNYCIDLVLYPLGSCTMKYNPKVNEKIASSEEFLSPHPQNDRRTADEDYRHGCLYTSAFCRSSRGTGGNDVDSFLSQRKRRSKKVRLDS
jgi:glycine cleavage system protein P-like pyridoxal-binding family